MKTRTVILLILASQALTVIGGLAFYEQCENERVTARWEGQREIGLHLLHMTVSQSYIDQQLELCRQAGVKADTEAVVLKAAQVRFETNCNRIGEIERKMSLIALAARQEEADSAAKQLADLVVAYGRIGNDISANQGLMADAYNRYMDHYRQDSWTAQKFPAVMPPDLQACRATNDS